MSADDRWLLQVLARVAYVPALTCLLFAGTAWMYGAEFKSGAGWWIGGAIGVLVVGLLVDLLLDES